MNAEPGSFLARELARDILFDEGVEAARNACVAGASIAAAAITAAAWYDNPLTGVPALIASIERLANAPRTLEAWLRALVPAPHPATGDPAFVPGFGFVTEEQTEVLGDACRRWVRRQPGAATTAFFLAHQQAITTVSGPLNQAGLAALCFVDSTIDILDAERIFLGCRIDIAISQAQVARRRGLGAFPFFSDTYVYEGTRPPLQRLDINALRQQVGLA